MSKKLEELRAKRLQQEAVEAKADEESLEKQLITDEEKIAELRKPGMKTVELGRRVALVMKPSNMEFERFIDTEPLTIQVHAQFLRSCMVYPSVDEIERDYPMYIPKLSSAACEMLGMEQKATAGKR